MPDITKKTETTPAAPANPNDMFQSMIRNFFRWDPFARMAPFSFGEKEGFVPSFEVKDTKEGYLFKADLPGVKDKDLELSLSGNVLTIKGKREEEKKEQNETYYTYERSYGSFSRSFTLPQDADANKTKAELKDGVLTLLVAKHPGAQPKKIEVNR